MDTKLLHPAHILLDVIPETAARGRTKVIISLISLSLITATMIAQDLHLIRHSYRNMTAKVMAKSKIRRINRCKEFHSL